MLDGIMTGLATALSFQNLIIVVACCLIGTGTAIFKPPLHGTLAHCVNERNSSVGWGMFYQVVNIGGFIGPLV